MQEIPVYLFTGFMDSGKTTLIQETLIENGFSEDCDSCLIISSTAIIVLSSVPSGSTILFLWAFAASRILLISSIFFLLSNQMPHFFILL